MAELENPALDDGHPRQVRRIALSLFDYLIPLHGYGKRERELLDEAAILHDIGWAGGRQGHHKRSFEMIVAQSPDGFAPREVCIIANLARYHRRALPKESHPPFASLAPADRDLVRRLGALLRVADGLDVTHGALVSVVGCVTSKDVVVVQLRARGECDIELAAAGKKSDLFEVAFGRRVEFAFIPARG